MSDPPQPRPSGQPQNTRAREIVTAKRRNTDPDSLKALPKGFKGWHTRGYLPHRDEPGLTQFVTFRLADSFPVSMRAEWESFFEIESDKLRRAALESFLDHGHGECWLRKSDIAELTENALRHAHGKQCELRAWVVMPNHVHVLFKVDATPMGTIVRSWKRYIAEIANGWLRRKGQFWQPEYWDTFMRDGAHEERARSYIERNPVKARLVGDMRDWEWSRARHRDEDGGLKI